MYSNNSKSLNILHDGGPKCCCMSAVLLHDEYITDIKLSLYICKTDITFLITGPCALLTDTLELPSRTSST